MIALSQTKDICDVNSFSRAILYFLKVLKLIHLSKGDRWPSLQTISFPPANPEALRGPWRRCPQNRPSTASSRTAACCTASWTRLTSLWDSVRSMWR